MLDPRVENFLTQDSSPGLVLGGGDWGETQGPQLPGDWHCHWNKDGQEREKSGWALLPNHVHESTRKTRRTLLIRTWRL